MTVKGTAPYLPGTHARFQRLSKGGDRVALADFQALPELAGNPLVPRVLQLADRDRDGYLQLQDFTDAVGELGRLHTDSDRAACARPTSFVSVSVLCVLFSVQPYALDRLLE